MKITNKLYISYASLSLTAQNNRQKLVAMLNCTVQIRLPEKYWSISGEAKQHVSSSLETNGLLLRDDDAPEPDVWWGLWLVRFTNILTEQQHLPPNWQPILSEEPHSLEKV